MTTTPDAIGYAFTLSLPKAEDLRWRRWAEGTPHASCDASGGHVTLARFTGGVAPERLVEPLRGACSGVGPVLVSLTSPLRDSYWNKPGLEIVMLVGRARDDGAGVFDLREQLLASMLSRELRVVEEGRPGVSSSECDSRGVPPARTGTCRGFAGRDFAERDGRR